MSSIQNSHWIFFSHSVNIYFFVLLMNIHYIHSVFLPLRRVSFGNLFFFLNPFNAIAPQVPHTCSCDYRFSNIVYSIPIIAVITSIHILKSPEKKTVILQSQFSVDLVFISKERLTYCSALNGLSNLQCM